MKFLLLILICLTVLKADYNIDITSSKACKIIKKNYKSVFQDYDMIPKSKAKESDLRKISDKYIEDNYPEYNLKLFNTGKASIGDKISHIDFHYKIMYKNRMLIGESGYIVVSVSWDEKVITSYGILAEIEEIGPEIDVITDSELLSKIEENVQKYDNIEIKKASKTWIEKNGLLYPGLSLRCNADGKGKYIHVTFFK